MRNYHFKKFVSNISLKSYLFATISVLAMLVIMTLPSHAMTTTTTQHFGKQINLASDFYGFETLANRPYPMYDYSVHLMKTGEDTGNRYRAFLGGRWQSSKGDGDHIMQYTAENGKKGTPWSMWSSAPEFFLGKEEGDANKWYSNNTMDPEVMAAADGSGWLMYVQVEIDAGAPIDISGLTANVQSDRIMLLQSTDCKTWTKWKTRGVVTNISNPQVTMLHHQEMVYVPWDVDGKSYWMYVCINVNGVFTGTYRIRSNDYKTFDFNTKELVSGIAEIGNQIGYLKEAPGGPLFVRITFVTDTPGRTVPALQFSTNGLVWDSPNSKMEGCAANVNNNNCYFLGIATKNGTGEIEYMGNNTWKTIYGATTCNSPVDPQIWYAQAGVGSLVIGLDTPVNAPVTAQSITTNLTARAPDGSFLAYGNSFEVYANGVVGAASVSFPTWTVTNGQDELKWIEGVFDAANNRWKAVVNRSSHNNEFGLYSIHVYAINGVGAQNGIGSCDNVTLKPFPVTVQSITTSTTQHAADGSYLVHGNSYTIYANGVTGASSVLFPTWTIVNGQDELQWITGVYDAANNRWWATVNRSSHNNEYGIYTTDVYGVDGAGQMIGIASNIRVTLNP